MLKVSSAGKKKTRLPVQVDILTVTDLISATNAPQGFIVKSFNGVKSKLPSSLPPTAPPLIYHRQDDNTCLYLCENG